MENMFRLAIIYIYPDGMVEAIPIEDGVIYHMSYMEKHVKNSARFHSIIGDYKFISLLHDKVDERMALNGVVSILNLDLRDIVEGYFNFSERNPEFLIYTPPSLQSLEQTVLLDKIYNTYPKDNLICECFNEQLDTFVWGKDFDMEAYLSNAKKEFGLKSL